ncbi:MAG: hypothetical protein IJY61_01780 [Candidatus Gastranaerophilales bacterium]|nr:hypothetical protein [Candidatus Gastranaerophilales bacterium]
MMINRTKPNINQNGRLNVFSINPKTGFIETKLIETSSIKAVKSSMINGEQINSLIYRTPNGVQKCTSLNISKDFTEDKLKTYIREQIREANSSGNVIDVLL